MNSTSIQLLILLYPLFFASSPILAIPLDKHFCFSLVTIIMFLSFFARFLAGIKRFSKFSQFFYDSDFANTRRKP